MMNEDQLRQHYLVAQGVSIFCWIGATWVMVVLLGMTVDPIFLTFTTSMSNIESYKVFNHLNHTTAGLWAQYFVGLLFVAEVVVALSLHRMARDYRRDLSRLTQPLT